MRMRGYSDKPIVPFRFCVLGLFGLDHAENATFNEATSEGRLVHKYQSIQWIAILSTGTGDRAEIEWKHGTFRQHGFEPVTFYIEIECVFVPTPFRCIITTFMFPVFLSNGLSFSKSFILY